MADESLEPETPKSAPKKAAATKTAKLATTTNSDTPAKTTAAKTTVEKVKEQVGAAANEAKDAARKAANEGKEKASEALTGVAKMVSDAANMVEEKVGATYGGYARRAADGVTSAAQSLQHKDIDDLIVDAREFVRKNPAVAIGAAAALGFILTRLAKIGASADSDEA